MMQIDLWAEDDQNGVGWVKIWFNKPNGGLLNFMWGDDMLMPLGGQGTIHTIFGPDGDVDEVGTYTYAYMEAQDAAGANTGQVHQDNPFNVPSFTYLE